MILSKEDKIWITISLVLLTITLISLIAHVYAQSSSPPITTQITPQQVETVKTEVQENSKQLDNTTLIAGGTAIGTLATAATAYLKSRSLEKSDKRTDRDTMMSQLYVYRLIQTMDAKIPEVRECLDQPFNSDPMQKDITIRRKLAEDASESAAYLMTTLNTSPPTMTPAAAVMMASAIQNSPSQSSEATTATTATKQNNTSGDTTTKT